jgi:type II secretion system protein J
MTRSSSNSGFTLLEVLVAMSLTVVLTGALYAALSASFRSRRIAEEALEPARRASATLTIIESDLEAACAPVGILAGPFTAHDTLGGNGQPADTLLFHAMTGEPSRHIPPSPIERIEYGIEEDSLSNSYVLVRRTTLNLLSPETPEPLVDVLCRRVRSFDVTYFDGLDWIENWDSTTQGNVLPLAIAMTLVLETGRESGYSLSRTLTLPCSAPPETEAANARPGGAG